MVNTVTEKTTSVVEVSDFRKTFYVGLRRRPFVAADGISFRVERGEIFGFLGPNGSGKTTTIKAVLGLIRPDSGELKLLGEPARSKGWRKRVGYLPEHPSFYEFLTGFELVVWFSRLAGASRHEAEQQARRALDRVSLSYAAERRLRSYSKGMLQRAGLAQAIVASPELLILDEPMTGLDPIGRRDVRELLLELRDEGRTILYSTHILPDVEMTCDRVAIIDHGKVQRVAALDEILHGSDGRVTVRLGVGSPEQIQELKTEFPKAQSGPGWLELEFGDGDEARRSLPRLQSSGAILLAFETHREALEDLFIRTLGGSSGATPREENP